MKKLAVLIILLMGIKGYSQHPELLDKEWFLHYGILEGETFSPPLLQIGYFDANCYFHESGIMEVYHNICEEGFITNVYFQGEAEFVIDNTNVAIVGVCSEEELVEFMYRHYSIYLEVANSIAKNPFTYSIESDGDTYMLTIENTNGDIAVYGNVPLSIEDFNTTTVSIYPNPVKELLFIESKENISNITVFDIHGKKVKTVSDLSEINLGGLQSGVYFVSITSENGGVLTQKIVKK